MTRATMYNGRRDFRVGRGMTIAVIAATVLFALAAYATYRANGWAAGSIAMTVATVLFGVGGIVECLVLRIQLVEQTLVVTDLRGRHYYAREMIQSIAEARGVESVLILADGRSIRLPSVGANVGNSVRAWLKN